MSEFAVCDTCSLIRLGKGDSLHLLGEIFSEIYLPKAVVSELEQGAFWKIDCSVPPFSVHAVVEYLPLNLGKGELECISLAKEKGIEFVVTDDRKAIRLAQEYGLIPLRSLDVLLLARKKGILSSLADVLQKMQERGEGLDKEMVGYLLSVDEGSVPNSG